MKLNRISVKDKKVFDKYLAFERHALSVYSFENIYIWKRLFDIEWAIIDDNLCVFFKDSIGCFLYISPLGRRGWSTQAIERAFIIMDGINKNKQISRIENAEAKDLNFYRKLGFEFRLKSHDYLCKRADLVKLQGDKLKSKRACVNYFTKNYQFEYLPFEAKYKSSCLRLYNCWMDERKSKNSDIIYQWMLKDSLSCLQVLLKDYSGLGLSGRVVKVGGKIKGFSFGFALSKDTFCILFEIADLSIKGIAQFIFREFCSQLRSYQYINIMDDSGLENLRQVKLSYHPLRLIPAYTIKRKNE